MSLSSAVLLAARQFAPDARVIGPLGGGLINDTFLAEHAGGRFVLQRINRQVFPDPEAIMANLRAVSIHVARRPGDGWRFPGIIGTVAGADGYRDQAGEFWRAMTFIEGTQTAGRLRPPGWAAEVGRTLGWFHRLVEDLPATGLQDTLPGFHELPGYLARFDEVMARTTGHDGSSPDLFEALDFVASRRTSAGVLDRALREGRLRLRVIHGDPKLDNILFDEASGRAVSLIDLDTVKPGLIHYDLGDCLRSCCNLSGEESSPEAGRFDMATCRTILQAYWAEAGGILDAADREYLFDAIRLLPFELGLRFLTDHLDGDRYFRVNRLGQNLSRARVQFRLAASVEAQEPELRDLLASLI